MGWAGSFAQPAGATMRHEGWSRTIAVGEQLTPPAELELRACCLQAGEQAVLYCSPPAGPRLALGHVTLDRPYCQVRCTVSQDVSLSCTGGGVRLIGILTGRTFAASARSGPAGDGPAVVAPTAVASPIVAPAAVTATAAGKRAPPDGTEPAAKRTRRSHGVAGGAPEGTAVKVAPVAGAAGAAAKGQVAAPSAPKAASPQAADQAKAKAKAKADAAAGGTGPAVRQQLKGGLEYEVLKPGQGRPCSPGMTVQVRYDGKLSKTGRRFDKGVIKFQLGKGRVIQGWDEGVKGMLRGEKRRLLIPARMGYGARGAPPDIPPNADLVFEVELLQC